MRLCTNKHAAFSTDGYAVVLLVLAGLYFSSPISSAQGSYDPRSDFALLVGTPDEQSAAFQKIDEHWESSKIPIILEAARFSNPTKRAALFDLLRRKTGQPIGNEHQDWQRWMWNKPATYELKPYRTFKSLLYGGIDPHFSRYFEQAKNPRIRLDEIVWGGVLQDGIPPLRNPQMVAAEEASYLENDHVVFGLEVNGDARAYPKRILAWHEMFVDTVGGVPVAGVYCTLCGSMILYETTVDDTAHKIGTSGFLYRSNKLMYDQETQSLWSTLSGEPMVGPLVGKDIQLPQRSVVTTTWGEWKKQHPDTQVLSLQTGHTRDYAEGAAYRDYFATDRLMFAVPETDNRLKNKDEVLALRFPEAGEGKLAIAANFLAKQPVYQDELDGQRFVVLTDAAGANRVYTLPKSVTFTSWDQQGKAMDNTGASWQVTESALTAPDGRILERLPAHRAFWFGWQAAFPETRLVGASS